MDKLKHILLAVVFFYSIFALYKDGISALMLTIFFLVIFVETMGIWMRSDMRKKIREKNK